MKFGAFFLSLFKAVQSPARDSRPAVRTVYARTLVEHSAAFADQIFWVRIDSVPGWRSTTLASSYGYFRPNPLLTWPR